MTDKNAELLQAQRYVVKQWNTSLADTGDYEGHVAVVDNQTGKHICEWHWGDLDEHEASANLIAAALNALATQDATSQQQGVVVPDSGELWSFCRKLLSQGGDIQLDYANGRFRRYEEYAARLDAAARERADEFTALLAAAKEPTNDR